jgi:hypothetical protein
MNLTARERVKDGDFQVKYCPTQEMIADILTKPIQGSLQKRLKDKILGSEDIQG